VPRVDLKNVCMSAIFKKVYRFDLTAIKPLEIVLTPKDKDFNDYLDQLIDAVIDDDRSKKYLFPADPTAIAVAIGKVLAGKNTATAAVGLADRLLRIEVDVQGRLDHLEKEVQKGILIEALVTRKEKKFFLLIKAEHVDFINESDNKRATGLPIKKKIFKAFCAYIDKKDKLTHAMVTDYAAVIASYWWKDYLELEPEYTNEYNTERSLEVLDTKVFNKLKRDHPVDHTYLRNATVQYFRSHKAFVMTDFIKTIVKSYTPEDDTLDVEALSKKILELPEKGKFDAHFEIVPEKLKKRIVNRIKLTPVLDLVIKENIDLKSEVSAFIDDGVKYIKIRTDEGYKYFKKEQ